MTAFVRTILVLAIIGALNWGLIGIFNWNLVGAIFGDGGTTYAAGFSRFVYVVVGLSGLVALFLLPAVRGVRRM